MMYFYIIIVIAHAEMAFIVVIDVIGYCSENEFWLGCK